MSKFSFYKTIKSSFFTIVICALLTQIQIVSAQTTVAKTELGYTFMRDGKPYYVKGSGGHVNMDKAVAIGSNSIRLWGIENAQEVLDEAQKRGLTVMLGFWLQHERHGFDYNDKEKVARQLVHFKSVIDKFKNHPALLMWGIGNELNLQYTNPKCWDAVQDIAKYAHDVDKNHPTSTVTAGLDSVTLQHIIKRMPDMDVFCINTYGDIENVPNNVAKFGWKGAYMITEWGPNGYWESPKTAWETSIEQTSTEKKQVYFDRYNKYIAPFPKCLGSYSFLWGEKQEYTETWFGLFSKENLPTEPVDALEMVYLNKNPEKTSPKVLNMTLNNQKAMDNIKIKADEKYTASVLAKIGINMTEEADDTKSTLRYDWKILAESTDKKSGGDAEEAAQEIGGLIQNRKKANIAFRAPHKAGAYRLFVSIYLNGKVAYANIPFWVEARTEADGQARFVEFKKATVKKEEE